LCGVALTKTELKSTLHNCGISEVDDGGRMINGGMFYQIGFNKRDWLYNCFAADMNIILVQMYLNLLKAHGPL